MIADRVWVWGSLIAGAIAVLFLAFRWLPPFAALVPDRWELLTGRLAITIVLLTLALLILRTKRPRLSVIPAALVLLVAATALIGHLLDQPRLIEDILIRLPGGAVGGSPGDVISIQSAVWIALLASMILLNQLTGADALVSLLGIVLTMATLVLLSGHLFNTLDPATTPRNVLNAWQASMAFLFLLMGWSGFYSLTGRWDRLISTGPAGETLRSATLAALTVPVGVATFLNLAIGQEWLTPQSAFAALAGLIAGVGVVVAALVSRRLAQTLTTAQTDSATQLWNAAGFSEVGGQLMAAARRREESVAVALLDLNGLKTVNDQFGHREGTRLITTFANLLHTTVRSEDLVARVGGDEFAVIVSGDPSATPSVFERLHTKVADWNRTRATAWQIDYAIGLAVSQPGSGESLDSLLSRADAAMYEDKRRGKREHRPGHTHPSAEQS
ncbi:MAG: GGDEF domain-containing protein [Actinomycetia bacterium]|nr:GGDEF domain-containing protein [Actinomycetes bacterium]